MNKINTEKNAKKLKDFIMRKEENSLKDVLSSKGYTSSGARGRADSGLVSAILLYLRSTEILGDDNK